MAPTIKKKPGRPPKSPRLPHPTGPKSSGNIITKKRPRPSAADPSQPQKKKRTEVQGAVDDELAGPMPQQQRKALKPTQQARSQETQRRPSQLSESGRPAKGLRKDFARLQTRTRYIPQSVIKSKWTQLGQPAQEQVKDILKAAKRPIVASRKDDKQRTEAETVLSHLVQRLESRLPNMPFPPATRDLHFDLEKLMERNRVLDSQLTTSLHALELLEAETEREERALQRDRTLLEKLEASAKDSEHGNKQKAAMMHPLLRHISPAEDDDPDSINLANPTASKPSVIDENDAELAPLLDQLRNHLESMQTNVAPVQGLGNIVTQAHASLLSTMFERLDTDQFTLLGG